MNDLLQSMDRISQVKIHKADSLRIHSNADIKFNIDKIVNKSIQLNKFLKTKRKQNNDKFDDIKEDQCSLPTINRYPSNKNIEDIVKIKDM